MIRALVLLVALASSAHGGSVPPFDFNRPTGYPVTGIKDVVNALDFGADPTNTFTSDKAIQNAFDYAAAHGYKPVYIPAGVYRITTGLTANNIIVMGDGPGGTGVVRGGTILYSGGGNMTSGTVLTVTDRTNSGSMRPSAVRDLAILCNASGASLGLQMPYPIEGIKLDVPSRLDNVRVQFCDYGIRTSSASGHQGLNNVQAYSNFCGMTVDPEGSGGSDGGNLTVYDSLFTGNSFAGVCVGGTTGSGIGDAHFVRTGFTGQPYGFYQFGPATAAFLASTIFDDCEFEAIGNNAFGVNSPSGSGGGFNNIQFRFIGYTSDQAWSVSGSSCVSSGSPYPCCTGSGTGCSKAYAIDVGTCNTIREEPASIHPFSTPSGGSGAIHCTQCQSQIKMSWDNGSSPVVTCDTHGEFVNIYDAQGRSKWYGSTPATSPTTCAATIKGAHYFDSNLGWDCFCNGSSWCWAHSPATCSSSSSCGTTSTSTSTTTTTSSSSTTTS